MTDKFFCDDITAIDLSPSLISSPTSTIQIFLRYHLKVHENIGTRHILNGRIY